MDEKTPITLVNSNTKGIMKKGKGSMLSSASSESKLQMRINALNKRKIKKSKEKVESRPSSRSLNAKVDILGYEWEMGKADDEYNKIAGTHLNEAQKVMKPSTSQKFLIRAKGKGSRAQRNQTVMTEQ